MTASTYRNGYWSWDNENNCLKFKSRSEMEGARAASITSAIGHSALLARANKVKFRDVVDKLEQIKFRRQFQRQCGNNEPDVVTLQDIKDVVLFSCDINDLSKVFISFMHTHTVDKFLRALIIYIQYYMQVRANILNHRRENLRKIWQPIVTEREKLIKTDLAELRCMVAREYLCIIAGIDDMKPFYHLHQKVKISYSERDNHLFEALMCVSSRIVWIALQRKHLFALIDIELNRLVRSEHFNLSSRRFNHIHETTARERQILRGISDLRRHKLMQRSGAINELFMNYPDHRMLAIGVLEIEPSDERLRCLEALYTAPEELLPKLGLTVGILGLPRNEFDAMLKEKRATRDLPELWLPSKIEHKDESIPQEFPRKPCKYSETDQTQMARERQRKIWTKYVNREALEDVPGYLSEVFVNEEARTRSSSTLGRSNSVRFATDSRRSSLFAF